MASEDVIELDSSEDDAEPAPKKKKPMPNAMVNIPKKMSEKTKKQLKSTTTFVSKIAVESSKNIKPIKPIQIQMANLINPNVIRQKANLVSNHVPGMKIFNKNINLPMMMKPKLIHNNATDNKMPNKRLKNPLVLQKSKLPINLPPCITVKPLSNAGKIQMSNKQPSITSFKTKSKKSVVGDVLTVELDDEEEPESVTEGPQWYLRPEEHKSYSSDINQKIKPKDEKTELSIEEQNNKEPENRRFVEITIEDSPVKLLQFKHEIGKELPITIEDSPIKPVTKNCNVDESDEENEKSTNIVPQSKKKLKYPKDNNTHKQVVEIEIDMMQTGTYSNNTEEQKKKDNTEQNVSCAESNSVKEQQENSKQTPTVEEHNFKDSSNNVCVIDTKDKDDEFHPTYQKFIDTCFELENSDDMKKIVDKKIKPYYKQSPKQYVESEEFIEMLTSKIISMKAGPDKMYLYIKDIVDELNLQRKSKKTLIQNIDNKEKETSIDLEAEKKECDDKRQRQIRKLEKTIKKLYRAIQKLEEQEVDFDDDEDSVYLLTERYKKRMVRVHEKLCQMTYTKMPSEPHIHIEVRPGRPEGPAKRLEMWINKKVPIGTPLPFPDFHDVLKCVREANTADNLGWNEVDIMEEARDLFTRCGKKLQRRRQENEWRIASSRVSHHVDPAESSPDLRKRLEENKSLSAKKESEVFNKYVEKQNQLKLEAEEIGDKEADESPVESEEEEDDVIEISTSQELKQKRKERIKLLLKDNSKNEEKENNPLPPEQSNIEHEINEDQTKNEETDTNSKKLNKLETGEPLGGKQINNDSKVIEIDNEKINMNNEANCISCHDDLNLLSELYSENDDRGIISSSLSSTDSLDSDSDAENRPIVLSDVISIEDSSYSENESMDCVKDDVSNLNPVVEDDETAIEIPTTSIENNTENINIINENILVGSSDDDNTSQVSEYVTCINLKDDSISITETTLDGTYGDITNLENNLENVETVDNIDCTNEKKINTKATVDSVIHENKINTNKKILLDAEMEVDSEINVNSLLGEVRVSEYVTCVNLKDDNISITETTLDGTYGDMTNLENNLENVESVDNIDCTNEKKINTKATVDSVIHENKINTNKKILLDAEMEVDSEINVNSLLGEVRVSEYVTCVNLKDDNISITETTLDGTYGDMTNLENNLENVETVDNIDCTNEKKINTNATVDSVIHENKINTNKKILLDAEMEVDSEINVNSLLGEVRVQCTEDVESDITLNNMETRNLKTDDGSKTNSSFIESIDTLVEKKTTTTSLNSVEQLNNAGHSDLNMNDNNTENKVINEVSNMATTNNPIES